MIDEEKVLEELTWFRNILKNGHKVPEYYEAQYSILDRSIKIIERLIEKPKEKKSSREEKLEKGVDKITPL